MLLIATKKTCVGSFYRAEFDSAEGGNRNRELLIASSGSVKMTIESSTNTCA